MTNYLDQTLPLPKASQSSHNTINVKLFRKLVIVTLRCSALELCCNVEPVTVVFILETVSREGIQSQRIA